LVVDEIQAGVGRTGYMFASEFHGIVPDAITLGKGLGGSGVQMAGILAGDSMRGLSATDHSFTFGTNTLAAAAALATVEIVSRPEFLANVRSCGAIIQTRLRDMQNRVPAIGDVRGVGLMIGVELVNPDGSPAVSLTESVISHAPDHGLQMRSARSGLSSTVKVRPPLIITPEESHLLCDRVESLLAAECR
jgi:4-aminobutyrate aminotransferase-like enzyme